MTKITEIKVGDSVNFTTEGTDSKTVSFRRGVVRYKIANGRIGVQCTLGIYWEILSYQIFDGTLEDYIIKHNKTHEQD